MSAAESRWKRKNKKERELRDGLRCAPKWAGLLAGLRAGEERSWAEAVLPDCTVRALPFF